METGSGQSCCTTKSSCSCSCCKGRLWCQIIFKLIIVGLLTCIASSLWHIDKGLALHAPSANAKP